MNIISEAIKRIKNHLNNSLGIFLTVQTPWTVTGKEANKLLDRLEKQYPKETPVITYIPILLQFATFKVAIVD